MKKKILFVVAAVAIGFSSLMASCAKSNKDVINEYRTLMNEAVAADNSGDAKKQAEVIDKLNDLEKEMRDRDFTTEEQLEILEIASSAMERVGY